MLITSPSEALLLVSLFAMSQSSGDSDAFKQVLHSSEGCSTARSNYYDSEDSFIRAHGVDTPKLNRFRHIRARQYTFRKDLRLQSKGGLRPKSTRRRSRQLLSMPGASG